LKQKDYLPLSVQQKDCSKRKRMRNFSHSFFDAKQKKEE